MPWLKLLSFPAVVPALVVVAVCAAPAPAFAAGGIPLPEPSSMLLLGLGVFGVAVGRKLSSKRRED